MLILSILSLGLIHSNTILFSSFFHWGWCTWCTVCLFHFIFEYSLLGVMCLMQRLFISFCFWIFFCREWCTWSNDCLLYFIWVFLGWEFCTWFKHCLLFFLFVRSEELIAKIVCTIFVFNFISLSVMRLVQRLFTPFFFHFYFLSWDWCMVKHIQNFRGKQNFGW